MSETAHGATAEKAELKSFEKPDDVRTFPKGRLELVNIGGATIGRAVGRIAQRSNHLIERS